MKKDCMQDILRINFFLEIIQAEGPQLLNYAEGVAKARTGLIINADQQGTSKVTLCHWKIP